VLVLEWQVFREHPLAKTLTNWRLSVIKRFRSKKVDELGSTVCFMWPAETISGGPIEHEHDHEQTMGISCGPCLVTS
jgi:hypothetical protein